MPITTAIIIIKMTVFVLSEYFMKVSLSVYCARSAAAKKEPRRISFVW